MIEIALFVVAYMLVSVVAGVVLYFFPVLDGWVMIEDKDDAFLYGLFWPVCLILGIALSCLAPFYFLYRLFVDLVTKDETR